MGVIEGLFMPCCPSSFFNVMISQRNKQLVAVKSQLALSYYQLTIVALSPTPNGIGTPGNWYLVQRIVSHV